MESRGGIDGIFDTVPHAAPANPQESLMRSSFLLSTALSVLSAAPAFAATPASPNDAELVVVTATRTAQDAERTGASIDVLAAADLKTRQTVVLTDALAQIPGVTVSRNGGVGQVTTLFTRGASDGET